MKCIKAIVNSYFQQVFQFHFFNYFKVNSYYIADSGKTNKLVCFDSSSLQNCKT